MLKIYQNISKISKKFDKNFKNISNISKKSRTRPGVARFLIIFLLSIIY